MSQIAVVVIHGMGEANAHQPVELKHRVTERYCAERKENSEEDLIWHTIEWGASLTAKQQEIHRVVNYRNDLDYPGLREIFTHFFGAALAYRSEADWNIKDNIDASIKEQMSLLTRHRRVQPDFTPMVVLAHSFGSVLMAEYIDTLHRRQKNEGQIAGLTPIEQFDTLAGMITFGSPLAVYSVYTGHLQTSLSIAGKALSPSIRDAVKWLNFYDKDDVVGYPLKGINEHWHKAVTNEFEVNVGGATTSWNPACHNEYWSDVDFFRPVAKYLSGLRKLMD